MGAGTTARASTSTAVAMTLAGPTQSGLDGAQAIRGIALHPPWKGRDGLRAGPRVSRGCDALSDCIDKRTQALHDHSDRSGPTSVVRVGPFQPVALGLERACANGAWRAVIKATTNKKPRFRGAFETRNSERQSPICFCRCSQRSCSSIVRSAVKRASRRSRPISSPESTL